MSMLAFRLPPVFLLLLVGLALLPSRRCLAAHTVASPGAGAVICVDPGHPSEVNSARTVQHGVTELAMNWQVAQRLAPLLRQRGFTVVLTKGAMDEYVTNKQRAQIANRAHASLLLRLHCDTGAGRGITLYAPDGAGHQGSARGPSPAVIAESQRAAHTLHDGMLATLGNSLHNNGIKSDRATAIGRRQGALTGSIYSKVPVVTVEMVYLSNASDARFIAGAVGQQQLAEALAAGVEAYLATRSQRDGAARR